MKSLVCDLDGSAARTAVATRAAEEFARVMGLEGKDALHLRLLAEELIGMVNGVLDLRDGQFWIEESGGRYELHLEADAFSMGQEAKTRILSVSSTGVNEAYQGVSGKIRMALDWFSAGMAEVGTVPTMVDGGLENISADPAWSLERLKANMAREDKAKAWDELEWSVLTRLADDVRVSLRDHRASIVVYKTF